MENPRSCLCKNPNHSPKLIAITGGPGAGKTAVLEIAKREFCKHVGGLPEAASIVYKGGFIRKSTTLGKKAVQRAIFRVQRELEWLTLEEKQVGLALCDRGTVDGLAYWPETESSFWNDLGSNRKNELARYFLVIHLRTPPNNFGYNRDNPLRIETEQEAMELDQKIERVWEGHPNRVFVDSTKDFLDKTEKVLEHIRKEVPACCQPQ